MALHPGFTSPTQVMPDLHQKTANLHLTPGHNVNPSDDHPQPSPSFASTFRSDGDDGADGFEMCETIGADPVCEMSVLDDRS
jgi:hypothetical protein